MNTRTYKKKFIDELEEQIWRKRVNSEFDKTKVPAVEKLRDDKFDELDHLRAELGGVDPSDTTKVTRMKRKELEGKIAKAEEFIVSCDETISLINESIKKDEEKINGLKDRVEFAKSFTYKDHASNQD